MSAQTKSNYPMARMVVFTASDIYAMIDKWPDPTQLIMLHPDSDGYYQLDEDEYVLDMLANNHHTIAPPSWAHGFVFDVLMAADPPVPTEPEPETQPNQPPH